MSTESTLYASPTRTIYPSYDHLLTSYTKKMEVDLTPTGQRSTQNEEWFKKLIKKKAGTK